MNASNDKCFICGSQFQPETCNFGYRVCLNCGHQALKTITGGEQYYIINEMLSADRINRKDFLDSFKQSVLLKCATDRTFLLDMGSASGRFLYKNKHLFKECTGIEITKECIDFSRQKLGLHIVESITKIRAQLSVVTFWHSLEHMPATEIEKALRHILSLTNEQTRIIISVPNADSLLYHFLNTKYAYYDHPNHLHQFTYTSLCFLMKKFGFIPDKDFFSMAYSGFAYLQTALNVFNLHRNFLYYNLKRGKDFKLKGLLRKIICYYNLMLLVLLVIPAIFIAGIDALTKHKAAVITLCFKLVQNEGGVDGKIDISA